MKQQWCACKYHTNEGSKRTISYKKNATSSLHENNKTHFFLKMNSFVSQVWSTMIIVAYPKCACQYLSNQFCFLKKRLCYLRTASVDESSAK